MRYRTAGAGQGPPVEQQSFPGDTARYGPVLPKNGEAGISDTNAERGPTVISRVKPLFRGNYPSALRSV
ncbi:hypothetical protein GWI33_009137 [Rhynchophorus ferrugineus]|uniref:Uncharacterized protein n=1 Tax=Rhynchophorus ferrugineus TaxID=354439 RepID=A0A834IH94_RHYFE|nr:hypothetical protein GWI33_009137 [Rhynchophorus ferrugineus]